MAPSANLMQTDPVAAIERVTRLFERERQVFMAVNCLSIIVILAIGVRLFAENKLETRELGLFFGSTGLITFSTSQVIRMWAESMQMLKIILSNGLSATPDDSH